MKVQFSSAASLVLSFALVAGTLSIASVVSGFIAQFAAAQVASPTTVADWTIDASGVVHFEQPGADQKILDYLRQHQSEQFLITYDTLDRCYAELIPIHPSMPKPPADCGCAPHEHPQLPGNVSVVSNQTFNQNLQLWQQQSQNQNQTANAQSWADATNHLTNDQKNQLIANVKSGDLSAVQHVLEGANISPQAAANLADWSVRNQNTAVSAINTNTANATGNGSGNTTNPQANGNGSGNNTQAYGGNSTLNYTQLLNSDRGQAITAIGQAMANTRVDTQTMGGNVVTALAYLGGDGVLLQQIAAAYTDAGVEIPAFKHEVVAHLAIRLQPNLTSIGGQFGFSLSAFIQLGNDTRTERGFFYGTGLYKSMPADLLAKILLNLTNRAQPVSASAAASATAVVGGQTPATPAQPASVTPASPSGTPSGDRPRKLGFLAPTQEQLRAFSNFG